MQNSEAFARSATGRVLDAILPALAERLAEALTPELVVELEKHIADGKAGEVADWAVRGCSEGLAIAADWLGRPESVRWEGRCARRGGLRPFGVRQISGRGSDQREETSFECLNPDGCGWPDDHGTWMPLFDDEKAPWDEMRRTAQEADQLDFNERQDEQWAWQREQQAKAREVLASLRRHIPSDRLQEVEDFLSTAFGCEWFRAALQGDRTRAALRKHVPVEHWDEIDDFLDRGIGTGRVSAALSAVEPECPF